MQKHSQDTHNLSHSVQLQHVQHAERCPAHRTRTLLLQPDGLLVIALLRCEPLGHALHAPHRPAKAIAAAPIGRQRSPSGVHVRAAFLQFNVGHCQHAGETGVQLLYVEMGAFERLVSIASLYCFGTHLIGVVGSVLSDEFLEGVDKVLQDTALKVDAIQNRYGSMKAILQIRKVNGVQTNLEFTHLRSGGLDDDVHKLNGLRRVGIDTMCVALNVNKYKI